MTERKLRVPNRFHDHISMSIDYFWNLPLSCDNTSHDHIIKRKYFPRYWPFVWGIHRSPVKSPHKGQWRGTLMFSLICVWINNWVNNREAGDLRRYRAHYDVTVMWYLISTVILHALHRGTPDLYRPDYGCHQDMAATMLMWLWQQCLQPWAYYITYNALQTSNKYFRQRLYHDQVQIENGKMLRANCNQSFVLLVKNHI